MCYKKNPLILRLEIWKLTFTAKYYIGTLVYKKMFVSVDKWDGLYMKLGYMRACFSVINIQYIYRGVSFDLYDAARRGVMETIFFLTFL